MARPVGAPAQFEVAAAFEHAVEEGFGRTRPQAASGLFVVKIMGRWCGYRSLTTWKEDIWEAVKAHREVII